MNRSDDDLAPEAPEFDAVGEGTHEEVFDRFVAENLKHNYIAHFMHGMLGMTGFRLIYAPTFVPSYLYMMTGSSLMVGIGQSLQQVGAILSPIVSASQIEHRQQVLPIAVRIGMMMRVQILGLALAGWFLTGAPLIGATFLFLFLLGFFTGAQRVVFQMLMAKVIPIAKRGKLQAYRNLAGGLIAAGLSFWAGSYLIDQKILGNGYSTTFMISFILTSLGLMVLSRMMREPRSFLVRPRMTIIDRMKEFPQLLADRDYRNFLIAQLFATAGRISTPFCIIHAGTVIELDGATLGILSLAFLGADTISNLLWGIIGDRRGFKITMTIAVTVWLGALVMFIFASQTWHFLAAFFALGTAMSGYMMSATTLVLEFGSRDDIPMRLALSTTAETSAATASPLIGGVIASFVGIVPVFLVSTLCLSIALATLMFAVCEPRNRSIRQNII